MTSIMNKCLSVRPSPVRVLTPELGDAATASCPCWRNLVTSFEPMSPLPPITTIFMNVTSISTGAFKAACRTR
jgi:hypothetical protein